MRRIQYNQMKYIIDKNKRPVYLQLYKKIRDDIISGIYPCGTKLPSKRLLASETCISTVTVEHAYTLLCDEGYAEAHERSGYIVIFKSHDGFAVENAESEFKSTSSRSMSDYPVFSVSILSKVMRKVLLDRQDSILEKSPNSGCIELRFALKQYLARNRGISVEINRIVVGSGAEYLYGLIVDLVGKDKIFAFEVPSYEKIEQIYRISSVKYERLPLCGDGIDSDALSSSKADILHTTPYRSFPTGITASASKRHEYLRWADKKQGRFIIESDYGSEFSVSSQPMETLFALSKSDNIIYLNTFSKTISPSMRVGYMLLPKQLVEPFEEKLGFYSCSVPTFEQFVLAELLNNGDFERHINRVRRAKRKALSKK